MNKIALIIKREYLSRVTKKSFIIMSLVGPMLFGMIFVVQFWLVSHEGEQKVIEIIDESGYFHGNMEGTGTISFIYPDDNLTRAKEELKANDSYGLLYIPDIDLNNPQGITFFAEKNPSIEVQSSLEWFIKNRIEEIRLGNFGIDKQQLDEIKTNINLNVINITDAGEKEGDVTISLIVGYIAAFLIYLFIFLYGLQTLRGVIEEKTSKIVEIIILR